MQGQSFGIKIKGSLSSVLVKATVSIAMCLPIAGSLSAQSDHYDQLPDLGSQAESMLSNEKAKILGRSFIRQSRYRMPYIYDPELLSYIDDIGKRLLRVSQDADKQYHFYLVDDNNINAFAVPGGHIALHKAILTKSESESELASVVAHEIAHITQAHISRRLENSKYDSWLALGALLAAVASGSSDAAQAAIGVSQASIMDRQLSFSRDFEAEADALGIRLLSRAGYDPAGMPTFFKRLLSQNRVAESQSLEFLRTHPLTVSRVTESANRVNSYPAPPPQNNERFLLMQAKINAAYSSNPALTRDQYKNKIDLGDTSLPTRFGYAVSLSKNGEFTKASQVFAKLAQKYPDNLTIQIMEADNELEANNIELGLKMLESSYQRAKAGGNNIVDLYYANALVLTNKSDKAIPIIREALTSNQNEPYLHFLLSRAYADLGDEKNSFIQRAEYHYKRGNYEFAIEQYKRAFMMVKTEYERESIAANIESIEYEIEAVKKLL